MSDRVVEPRPPIGTGRVPPGRAIETIEAKRACFLACALLRFPPVE